MSEIVGKGFVLWKRNSLVTRLCAHFVLETVTYGWLALEYEQIKQCSTNKREKKKERRKGTKGKQ